MSIGQASDRSGTMPGVEAAPESRHSRVFAASLSAVAWMGLTLQFCLAVPARMAAGHSLASALIWFFSFFTILTNLAVALSLTLAVKDASGLRGWLAAARTRSGLATAIVVVGVTYELVLRRVWQPTGLAWIADTTLHDVVPLLYVVYWLAYVPKGRLTWRDLWGWLWYPGIYLVYVLGRGALTDRYPYLFLDIGQIGYERAAAHIILLLLAFMTIGAAVLLVDGWMSRRRPELRHKQGVTSRATGTEEE